MSNSTVSQKMHENPLIIYGAMIISIVLGYWLSNYWISAIVIITGLVLLRSQKGKKGSIKSNDAYQQNIQNFYALGSSKDERESAIDKIFSKKEGSFSFSVRWEYANQVYIDKTDYFFIGFRIIRNLIAMPQNEREFLRAALLLFNAREITEGEYTYFLSAFVNGDGKATVDVCNYYLRQSETATVKDYPSAVAYYMGSADASVSSATNQLMNLLDKSETPLAKKLKKQFVGGGSFMDESDIHGTPFDVKGENEIILGPIEGSNVQLSYSGEGSIMTIAPPRSGKSQCLVIPNLLNWKSSALVLDISGELFELTGKWRANNVGPVYKFNPLDPDDSHCYNPLTFIRKDPTWIWEDSRFLADMMIVVPGGSSQNPFWDNMARDILTAAIAYTCFYNEPEERAMSKVLDIIYGIGWDEMIVSLKTNPLIASMRRTGNTLGELEKKTRESILITAQSYLSAWQGERISRTTEKSDWNPLDLRTEGNITVYICIKPNEIDSYLSLLRVFIAQHVEILLSKKPDQDKVVPILYMLDEFPRLKNMPPIDKALNAGAKYGIRLWMFAQSYGQLKESYENAEGMLGSCAISTFMNLPLNDELTTKISDQLGYRDGPLDATRIKVAEPLELAGPNYRDTILVFATNAKPVKVRKNFAYLDEELKKRMA